MVLPWSALEHDHVDVGDHRQVPTAPRRHGSPAGLAWCDLDAPSWLVGGLSWRAGWDLHGDRVDRELIATATTAAGVERTRVPLGRGSARDGLLGHGRLWFALHRGRFLHVDHARGVEVVALDPATGAFHTVLTADAVDISDRCRPLPSAPPADAEEYAERWRRGLAEGHGITAVLEGAWPDRAVRVTLRHRRYADGVLTRRIPLFDELGRPTPPEYCDVHLIEDLDTHYLPPVTEAVDGVLEI